MTAFSLKKYAADIEKLSRITVVTPEEMPTVKINEKKDEEKAVKMMTGGKTVILEKGWEIIPVENVLAQSDACALEVESLDRAIVAAGILEIGAKTSSFCPKQQKS